jgi:hypothetical protein
MELHNSSEQEAPEKVTKLFLNTPFVLDHLQEVSAKFDAMQRITFVPSIGAQSLDGTILKQLREFINANVPAANKAQVERFYADMVFRLSVRDQRIPEIDAWLARNG